MKLFRVLTVVLSLSLLALTGYLVKNHITPYNIISVLDSKDPVYIRYQEHLQKYNDENDIYVLLESSGSLLQRSDFSQIVFETSERFKRIPNLVKVTSLKEVEFLANDGKRTYLKKFFEKDQMVPEGLELLKNNPVFQYSYLSPDEKATLIYISMKDGLKAKEIKQVLDSLHDVENLVEKTHSDLKVHILGTEVARDYFVKEIIKSQAKILPLVLMVILILLYALFRTWKVCLLSMYVMGLSYFCSVCLIISLEGNINPFSSFALLFIFIISTADIVHLFSAVSHSTAPTLNEKFKQAIADIWTPCLVCAVTTWIGLLSLVVSDTPPIRYFGIYCAFGVALCFFLTFYFIPWFVRIFDLKLEFKEPWIKIDSFNILNGVRRFRKSIVILFLAVMLGLGYLSSQLKADDNLYRKFKDSHPLTQAVDAFEKYFYFTGSIDVVLQKPREAFINRDVEKNMAGLQDEISQVKNVAHIKSLANYQMYMRGLFPKVGPEISFKDNSDLAGVFNLFEDYQIMTSYYPQGYSEVRMSVFLKAMDTQALLDAQNAISEILKKPEYANEFKSSIEGFSTVRSAIFATIFSGFIKSFVLDFFGIFLCFIIFFRSFSWASLAMIPNILPLVAVGGLMKILNMTVDYNLIVLVAIIFGIAVDDTTHFIYYLLKNYRKSQDINEAISHSLQKTSVALTSTTFIFAATMPTFFLTDILMFSQVAVILVLSLILGLAGDMFVLPALLFSRRVEAYMKWATRFAKKEKLT